MPSSLEVFFQYFRQRPEYLNEIVSITYMPHEAVDLSFAKNIQLPTSSGTFMVYEIEGGVPRHETQLSFNRYSDFPSVTESKLLMHPYSYLELNAWNGSFQELKLEHFSNNQVEIMSMPYFSSSPRMAYLPKNYNGDESLNHAVIVSDYPEIATTTDGYGTWLATNKTSTMLNVGTATVATLAGIATGNPMAIAGGVTSIASVMASKHDAQRQPNNLNTQAGGSGFNLANYIYGCSAVKRMIKPEYQEQLTKFWKAYGYAYNKIEVPRLYSRAHFNYLKTLECNLKGNVPHEDFNKIKNIFDAGITLWHTDDIGNYDLANGEV